MKLKYLVYFMICFFLSGGVDGNEMELQLTLELRFKIRDMYIDPGRVTFNPASDPIGTGKVA